MSASSLPADFPVTRDELRAVLAPFEEARPLPPAAYLDAAVLDAERAEIFEKSWLAVGREDEVLHPGEWLMAPVAPEGVVVVRGPDLVLRAFRNVCRHRAALLVSGERGRVQELTCPYHGWTYELTGALRDAPYMPPDLDRAASGLLEVAVDVWQGFVFVALDRGIAPLAAALEPLPAWLRGTAPALAHARRARRSVAVADANWKLLAENFQESHHFAHIHPALERLTPSEGARSVLSSGPWLGGTMRFAHGVETVSATGKRGSRPFLAGPDHRTQVSDALLFPTLLTSLQPDYFLAYRLTPLTPARTRVVADLFVHPAAGDDATDDLADFWDLVNAQDRAACESQQRGLASRGYRASRYSTVEDGVHAFDAKVARAYEAHLQGSP